MIQHRSGIPNFTDNPAYWKNEQENGKSALDFALDLPASFEPNGGYEYSNTNYLLLRRIMDDVLGYSHNQYIKEKILIPFELKNTYFSIAEVNLDDVMSGYYVGYDEDFKARDYGMLATAEDVAIFIRAAVVVQFINTTDFEGYEWNLSEIIINRIVKIINTKN